MEVNVETKKRLPNVFIGSSVEALYIAREVQDQLYYDANVKPWTYIFEPSSNTLDDLMDELEAADFGIFVFSPEDKLVIRDQQFLTVRDNVLFEFGLFIGKLGKKRCFYVVPSNNKELHLPTDLLGTKPVTYDADRDSLKVALGNACNRIRGRIEELSFFRKNSSFKEEINDLHFSANASQNSKDNLTDLPQYLKEFVQQMDNSNSLTVQKNALKSLAQSKHQSVCEALVRVLEYLTDAEMRLYAAFELAKRKDLRAVPVLLEALNEADEDKINKIASALKKIGKVVIPSLIEALSDTAIQEGVIITFGMIGASALPDLIRAIQDEDSDVCYGASRALGKVKNTVAVPELLKVLRTVLYSGVDNNVRDAVIWALGNIGDASAVPDLLAALKSTHDHDIRSNIIRALGDIRDATAVLDLLIVLHEDKYVRLDVIWALGNIGDASAVPDLCTLLFNENRYIYLAASEALGNIGDAAAVPDLLKALHTQDRVGRSNIILALGNIGDAAIPEILEALHVEYSFVRSDIIQALKNIGTPKAEAALKSVQ